MGLLSDADILQYVAKGEIGIEPFDAGNLTPNGYDVSVDEVVVPATEGKPDPNRIPPRARFAVSTRETIQLGRHVAGQIWLRVSPGPSPLALSTRPPSPLSCRSESGSLRSSS